ncbi:hypothetical protein PENTCL1PPCAC_25227, partial [Pristionchus entomophagus]
GAVSAFGVNQPFILALIGIVAMLGLTVFLVSGDPSDDYLEVPTVKIRSSVPRLLRPTPAVPRKML